MFLSHFQTVGHELFARGLVSSCSGNISIRIGDRIIITRRSCMLNCLQEQDLIETGINKNDRSTPFASLELPVHRAIYQTTPALAIIHAHSPHTVALSLVETEIIPNDAEILSLIGRVPILGWNMEVKPGGLADTIAQALKHHRIVIVHGHGSFAIGQILDEAHKCTTTLEESCQVICLLKSIQVNAPQK
ncbi:aldolase [Chloroflexota bacterium]